MPLYARMSLITQVLIDNSCSPAQNPKQLKIMKLISIRDIGGAERKRNMKTTSEARMLLKTKGNGIWLLPACENVIEKEQVTQCMRECYWKERGLLTGCQSRLCGVNS